ncbi:hypothetical protein [[Ruminococcus] lactaris]|uniref:Uncharacterized protein n=1 Tax=[Ruminococcus] lactaris TaxID=46228 RepID=A0A414P9H3_9FIRM|nr:hypothetical protein [[Ruminococcus] lactaris]RHF62919.1 hypothetical protein DW672_01880 [[Ruminococcus] lactaris]
MKIKVVNQRLYLEPPETAEGTREYLKAEFSFSGEWDGMTKTAFFRGAGNTYSQLLKDDACTVPAEALAAPGRVGVSVSGTLGETITAEQLATIRDGSFKDLYVGDYWEKDGVKYRIADINYWKNVGYPESEKVQKPHVLIVPDTILGSGQMNANNSTAGGYRNSAMKTARLNQIADSLPDTFKNILISHRMFSDGSWGNTSVDLMNEVMVHGTYICTDNNNKQTSDTQQLSLFRLCPELKSIGQNYWLRNVAGSQTYTLISQYGDASSDMATSTYGIRPVFAVG